MIIIIIMEILKHLIISLLWQHHEIDPLNYTLKKKNTDLVIT
jgi:hypothetical protein